MRVGYCTWKRLRVGKDTTERRRQRWELLVGEEHREMRVGQAMSRGERYVRGPLRGGAGIGEGYEAPEYALMHTSELSCGRSCAFFETDRGQQRASRTLSS